MADSGWINIGASRSLLNGWTDVTEGEVAAYRLIDSLVHLRGVIVGGGSQGLPAFVLPSGYQPTAIRVFGSAPTQHSTWHMHAITIAIDGTATPATTQVRLDGIVFLVN